MKTIRYYFWYAVILILGLWSAVFGDAAVLSWDPNPEPDIAANETVAVQISIQSTDVSNPQNTRIGITVPSGGTYALNSISTDASNATGLYSWGGQSAINLLGTASGGSIQTITGTIQNGATAGNVVVQFGQQSNSANTITIKKGATIRIIR